MQMQASMPGVQQASPEEQAQLERFVDRAQTLIYDEKRLPQYIQLLGSGDPVDALADAAVMTVDRVNRAAAQQGIEVSGDVLFAAGREVIQDLADLATNEGIHDFQNDQDSLDKAYFKAIDDYRKTKEGEGALNQEASQQDVAALTEMDQKGELGPLLRALDAHDMQSVSRTPPMAEQPPQGLGSGLRG